MAASQIEDKSRFFQHLRRIYSGWNESPDMSKIDAISICVGADDDVAYSKSTSIQVYLFGYELTDMLMLFCRSHIYFLTSKKKIDFLRPIENAKENIDGLPPIILMNRDKSDKDKANFEKLIRAVRASGNGKNVGVFAKDKFTGEFYQGWHETLKAENFSLDDISMAIALMLASKDEGEIAFIKKACEITCIVFQKFLREQIINAVDQDKKIKHSKLTDSCDEALGNPKYIAGANKDHLDMCFPPIIQSGGNYSLKFSVSSDKNQLHFGNILCSLGVRYRSYCSNVSRTMLVDPSPAVQEVYTLLLEAEIEIMNYLKPGVKLCDAYDSAVQIIKAKRPDLLGNFTKTAGFGTGIEFRETALLIGPRNEVVAKKGMVFIVAVGFTDIVNSSPKDDNSKNLAFFISDTVLVAEDGPAITLTEAAKSRTKSIFLFFKTENDTDKVDDEEPDDVINVLEGRGKRSTVILQDKMRNKMSNEEKRKERQKELADQINKEARERIAQAKHKGGDNKMRKSNVSYKNFAMMPTEPEVKQLKIFVDRKYETIILPVFGIPVPFHISMIKNISQSVEGDFTYLRINFFHPGAFIRSSEFIFPNPDATFLKELTFRSSNLREPGEISQPSANLNLAFRLIKEVQKKFKTREAEEKEKEGIVRQDKLILSQNKANPRLKDLYIRPNIVTKRISGSLEAHVNGFRYTSIRGDKVDILYNNIKHAFFQPCDHEMIILLHFHLKNAILFGKRKHVDIQFFTEVGEITTDLGKHHHMHDREDYHAEQVERELRQKLNQAFKSFYEKVEKLTNQEIEFDVPFRDLGFHGVPFRSSVLLQPTSGCLVNLNEWPPFVVTLEEVELVHFERIMFHLKNFDMVFVFKDYTKKPAMVNAVPMNMLDHVKEWLNSCDIRYTEGVQSLNWPKIMKTIIDDPEEFFGGGGWNFLNTESDNEEAAAADDTDDEDDAYDPSGSEEEEAVEDEEDSDENYESEASDDSEGSDNSLSSEAESGKSWSELEEEAKRADKDKEKLEVDDERRKRKGVPPSGSLAAKRRK